MKALSEVNEYFEPDNIVKEIDLTNFENLCLSSLEKMMYIRAAERQLALGKKDGLIGGPVHLGVGQEACAVGVANFLRSSDRVFGAHRSHAHILSMDMNIKALFAEVLGKETGFSKGMGGSMHLCSQSAGFLGSVPIVSGTVSLALGAGLTAKLQKKDDVAVAFFGDGAVEEGVVHECLNFASIKKLPVIFVVENNLFASHMHISLRQPKLSTTRFAEANSIKSMIVDGNNISAVSNAARELVTSSRAGDGPAFLELVTYRWYGHVDWRDDIDVGVNRSASELKKWKSLDPIERLKNAMFQRGIFSEGQFFALEKNVNKQVYKAWKSAFLDPYPEREALTKSVYSG